MKNKNILITCDDLGILGGSVITTIRFANALCSRGWNVTILTCNSNTIEELDPRIKIEFATWYFFLSMGKNWGKVAGFSPSIIRKVIEKYDIGIVLSSHLGILGWCALLIANRSKIPSFSLCSGQIENATAGFPKYLNNFVTVGFFKFLIGMYYSQAKFILSQSNFSTKVLEDFKVHSKVEMISNGVNLKIYKKIDSETELAKICAKYHISKEFFNVVFLGRLAKEKCVHTLFHCLQKLIRDGEKVHLYLVGNGPEKDNLINLSKLLGIEHNVSFLGFIPQTDVVSVLSLCDLYVHPSEIELEGMALLEAMACGLPILVSDSPLSASKQFVSDNGAIFSHNDAGDLANKILDMMLQKLEGKFVTLSENSLTSVQKYSFDVSADRFSKLFEEYL